MWDLLPRKAQLTLIVLTALLCIRSYDVIASPFSLKDLTLWQSVTLSVTFVGTLLCAVAEFCWRWVWRKIPLLQRKVFPDLNGEWTGELASTWINPDTGQVLPPIPTKIEIRQGLFSTSVSLRTGESESHSKRVHLERLPDIGRFRIWYDYQNGPKAAVEHRSQPHAGFAYLEVDRGNLHRIEGRYYTARKTTGDITVERAPSAGPD